MCRKLIRTVILAILTGDLGLGLFILHMVRREPWMAWACCLTGLVALALFVELAFRANVIAGKIDHWMRLQDMMSREMLDCLERQRKWNNSSEAAIRKMRDPEWIVGKINELYRSLWD